MPEMGNNLMPVLLSAFVITSMEYRKGNDMRHTILTLSLAALGAAMSADTMADETCLPGKWQLESETLNIGEPQSEFSAGVWRAEGGLVIEILPTAEVRLAYTDYVVTRTTNRSGYERVLEVRYNGETAGRLTPSGDQSLSLKQFGDVARSVRGKVADGEWIATGDENETPPHEQGGYDFKCEGDELTLSMTVDGPFGGDYSGRFARID
jgi:hypothetical protein